MVLLADDCGLHRILTSASVANGTASDQRTEGRFDQAAFG
jgi:hypothetical protein